MIQGIVNWLRSFANRLEAAKFSPSRRHINTPATSARFDISESDRITVLGKVRHYEQNDAILRKIADIHEIYTVGSDLVVQPASSSDEWNKVTSDEFWSWAENPDLTSRMSLGAFMRRLSRRRFFDGEAFVLKTAGPSGTPRVQLIESHLCGTPKEYAQVPWVIDGVIVDSIGRPAAYFIGEELKPNQITYGAPTGWQSVCHVFDPERGGQYRGVPTPAPVIHLLQDLEELKSLEMLAAKDNARVVRFIKSKSAEIDPETAARGEMTESDADRMAYYESVVGAEAKALYRDDDVLQFAGERPSVVTQDYWKSIVAQIGAACGVAFVQIFPESVQGTVYRGTLDMETSYFRGKHAGIAAAASDIYRHWVIWAVNNIPKLRECPPDFRLCRVSPPRAPNVDVGRNSAAMLAELAAGATNYERIYSPLGLDWREEFAALAEQQKVALQLGLNLQIGQQQKEGGEDKGGEK